MTESRESEMSTTQQHLREFTLEYQQNDINHRGPRVVGQKLHFTEGAVKLRT